ncbi:hypothetical protein BDZ91DRAFT_762662 [Kalaharituber pfeilii]|nr:hypothetical protein BDZ91DRAFT_762662 [Kalaharituber pfeilii]
MHHYAARSKLIGVHGMELPGHRLSKAEHAVDSDSAVPVPHMLDPSRTDENTRVKRSLGRVKNLLGQHKQDEATPRTVSASLSYCILRILQFHLAGKRYPERRLLTLLVTGIRRDTTVDVTALDRSDHIYDYTLGGAQSYDMHLLRWGVLLCMKITFRKYGIRENFSGLETVKKR